MRLRTNSLNLTPETPAITCQSTVLQLEVEFECGQIEVEVDVELEILSSKIIGYFVALKRTEDGASWPPSRAFMAKDARELPC